VGRLEKVKGHTYLIDAFAHLKKEIRDARMILVGDGTLSKDLRRKVKGLRLEDSVEFTGEIAHSKLPRWFKMADVFVMPSLSEGFGICALEAMASGVPVIATRVGSLPEIILDGETGILLDKRQPAEIYRAIMRIFKNKDFAAYLSENGKKRAAEFSWDKSAEKVYKIYQSLL
jgi:glycosyltransferase involved in cell wall biosynthesis